MLTVMLKHTKIPSGERIRVLHSPCGTRLTTTLLVSKGLFRLEENRVLGIGIDDGYAEYLKSLLHGSSTTGPEPVDARGFLAGLGYVARINGYCDAMSLRRFQERPVERQPVERLLEVLSEPAFARAATPRHLGEVESSGMREYKFHGLDEEGLKRFA